MSFSLDAPLHLVLPDKDVAMLTRAFGMETVGDIVAHYPRRYATHGERTPISGLIDGENATIVADIVGSSTRPMRQRRGSILEVTVTDGHGEATLAFFNQKWRERDLMPGRRGMFAGKVSMFKHRVQLNHPNMMLFDDDTRADELDRWRLQPIPFYPATSKIPTWELQKYVYRVLDELDDTIPDPMPADLRFDESLLTLREAIEHVHRPVSLAQAETARHTLRMHEALLLQSALVQQRQSIRALPATARAATEGGLLERFDAALPFELTRDQQAVGRSIAADLVDGRPMNRLVQGEVGSGKTLVALRAMLQVAESTGQAALIAPTEVLAAQHLRSITKMLGPDLSAELMPTLVTGQMGAAERRKAALRVAAGQARIVIGTHALLSEKTTFADLGLVVVDEQHRFGVEQRDALRMKGFAPHVLVLTATPIPRTVAMTVFGDLDVSTIRSLPAGRSGIETYVAPLDDKPQWWQRVWERAAEEIDKGRQVFAVCAAIEVTGDGEAVDEDPAALLHDDDARKGPRWGVVQVADLLQTHPRLSGVRRAVLHGKMPADEKDATMQAFARGEIDILIATTVIEVGVDVPNASTMIILEADRFGVSQLHQLRGRVGRGAVPGLCLLVTEAPQETSARERVEAVARTLDGFELAEIDLELRGEGDVLGDAQSGSRSSLKLLRVVADAEMIARARGVADRIFAADPELAQHPHLAEALKRRVTERERAAMSKS